MNSPTLIRTPPTQFIGAGKTMWRPFSCKTDSFSLSPNPTSFLSSSGDEPLQPWAMGHYLEGHSPSPRVMIPVTRAFTKLHAQVPTASGSPPSLITYATQVLSD